MNEYKLMNKNAFLGLFRALLVLLILLFTTWMPDTPRPVYAALCSGADCTGLNPNTMQCANIYQGNYKNITNGYVEGRYSTDCDAEWARNTNKSTSSMYVAVSQCHGGSNYDYCSENVSSPQKIAYNQVVYTAMRGPRALNNEVACGSVSSSGPIAVPINYYTGSPYCTGVY